jgi:hypothetical protein
MVVPVREFVFVIVGSLVLGLVLLAVVWPWARVPRRLAAIGLSAAAGIFIWNLALDVTGAAALNVDSRFLGLSVQDVGSGVAAFIVILLVLRFATERTEPAWRALTAAAVVGVVTIAVDLLG